MPYDKFCLETLSCSIQGRETDGWMHTGRADGLAYGFEQQFAERIFKPFQRLHGRSSYEGTGMGLAISKRIVEIHGGRLWVESQRNRGATFHFTLPAG